MKRILEIAYNVLEGDYTLFLYTNNYELRQENYISGDDDHFKVLSYVAGNQKLKEEMLIKPADFEDSVSLETLLYFYSKGIFGTDKRS